MLSGPRPTPKFMQNRHFWLLFAAAGLAFSMWFYVVHILVPYQIADAALQQRPRGNLSDLYPRWLGARELWLHHRDPYGPEVTRDIQAGYYGRPLDPRRSRDPGDQQGFAYPVYVTFLLLPSLRMPFEEVRFGFTWLLVGLTACSVLLWLRALRWIPRWQATCAILLLTLGSFAALQGVKLQQLTLVVAALVAACAALLTAGQFFAAGMLLAIATIKPQLVALLSAFLMLWSWSDWRKRRGLFWGFILTLSLLFLGAQWLLPGWVGDFWQALRRYQQYTGGQSRLDVLLGSALGKGTAAALVLGLALVSFRARQAAENTEDFILVFAAILVTTLLVMPNFAPYNELLLLPAILLIAREIGNHRRPKGFRTLAAATGFFLSWGWIAAVGLTVASLFVPASSLQQAWAIPLWSEFAIAPSVLVTLALLLKRMLKPSSIPGREPAVVVTNGV